MEKFTQEHINNLIILRDFLRENVEESRFEMAVYCAIPADEEDEAYIEDYPFEELTLTSAEAFFEHNDVNECNTSMCMLGWSEHVPDFSEHLKRSMKNGDTWSELGYRLFGMSDQRHMSEYGPYLFSCNWDHPATNTISHACARIDSFIKAVGQNRLPEISEMYDKFLDDISEDSKVDFIDPDDYLLK